MKKILSIFSLTLFLLSSAVPTFSLDEVKTYKSILKIKTYTHNTVNNTYSLSHLGSAVAIGSGLILTNAHVVFDKNQNKADGFYEVCRTLDYKKKPVCFTTAELLAYDEESDLALLRFAEPSDLPISHLIADNSIKIGEKTIVYGYPGIGGDNISRTEGNIAGYEDPFYKIDGAIDHGNSGGGAFNLAGELIGIPSRVSSDNAVIGFMIPMTTIEDFLHEKTKGYTKIDIPPPQDFKEFIKQQQRGERNQDSINDSNIKTSSLKKYGLKYSGKLEGTNSFLYAMNFSNLSESYAAFGCFRYASSEFSMEKLDKRTSEEDLKKYQETRTLTGANDRYVVSMLQSLISSDNGDLINIYDTTNTCAATIYGVSIKKDKKLIEKAIAFFTSGVTLKKSYPQNTGFETQIFRTNKLPAGISIKESPGQSGNASISLGYFGPVSNTGEALSEIKQKKKDTLDAYFLGGTDLFDNSPTDSSLTPSDYSIEAYRKTYEKAYTGKSYRNTNFRIIPSKNGKDMIVGISRYIDTDNPSDFSDIFIFSYPYTITTGTKKEYYELKYIAYYDGGNEMALKQLEAFFTNIELIGSSPF